MTNNLRVVAHRLKPTDRTLHYGHEGGVIWLTGLPASGKSSIAMALEEALTALGYSCYVLDGDNIRHGLNADLGFSPEDRAENIRRIGEVAALFADAGLICITAFISPYRAHRQQARNCCSAGFHEIHLAAGIATCEARDPKGHYQKARAGALPDFTGVSSPYEAPEHPELTLATDSEPLATSVDKLVAYVRSSLPLRR